MREWSGDEVIGLSSSDVDIRDAGTVSVKWCENAHARIGSCWPQRTPTWTVARAISELAFAVNRDGAVNVAQAAKQADARSLLFLSSDYVFDGKKTSPYETDDPRNPQSVYGRSKAEAEDALAGNSARVLHRADFVAVRELAENVFRTRF